MAMGDGVKRPQSAEIDNRRKVRKSLVARVKINSGEVVKSEMLVEKRPGYGIAPKNRKLIIGMRTTVDIEADSVVEWKHFKDGSE